MGTSQIRRRLHNYLEVADDKKLKALYAIMEDKINESAVAYTDDFKKELDKRQAAYKTGKEKVVSSTESKKRISSILKAGICLGSWHTKRKQNIIVLS
jgi:hypothetical protein